MVDASLAQFSNSAVYASMVVFTGSFISFAVSLSASRDDTIQVSTASGKMITGRKTISVSATDASDTGSVATLEREESGVDSLVVVPGRRAGNIGLSLMWLATLLLAVAVTARGISAGRPPWGNMYEFSLMSALAASAVFLGVSIKKDLRWLGVFVTGAVLLTLGLAVTVLYTESAPLVPALKSWWLIVHVTCAIICSGAFTIAAFLTVSYLVKSRAEKKAAATGKAVSGWFATRVPSAERLDTLSYRILMFAFPLWTFTVIAGAIWAENAWGRYWGWDPKETWAFITWVVYAAYLHARATVGWRGGKAAAISLLGFGCFLFNYFGINMLVSGLHSYAGVN